MQACSLSAWSFTPPVLFTLLVCCGVIALAAWVRRQRAFPGRRSFVIMHLASLWWMVAASLEMSFHAPYCKIFWASMAWPGILIMPTFWAIFLWQYVHSIHVPVARRTLALLLVGPACFWLMALTNPRHELFYGPGSLPISGEPGAPIRYQHGILFFAAAVYVYAFMVFCVGVVLRAAILSKGLHRRHYLAFVLLTCVPWAANISYVVFAKTLFGFDPTPFSFALTLAAFAWLIAGVRLFDLLPFARHLLLEALLDPVLVIDPQRRVIEANPAALALANRPSDWQGCDLNEWPVYGADLVALLEPSGEDLPQAEAQEGLLTLTQPGRYFEVRSRTIKRAARQTPGRENAVVLGKMLYLRDVTQRYLSELKLAEALAVSEERLHTISQLHEQLREQALCDPLTGLYNRRYLDEFFARELARVQRENSTMALALIDLDHFKRLNDQYGHLAGDDVLKGVAQQLQRKLRATDALFRIGGEEFLLMLPHSDLDEARLRLQGICRELAATTLPTREGDIQVTLSAGLAHWPRHGRTLDALMQVADAALYQAKHAGRNRVFG